MELSTSNDKIDNYFLLEFDCSDKVPDFICLLARVTGALIYSLIIAWKLTIIFLLLSPLLIVAFNRIITVREL